MATAVALAATIALAGAATAWAGTTAAPVLTSPVAGATQNTLSVSYSLPDTPLPNSVTLTFANQTTSQSWVLTMDNSQTQSVSLNPHAPITSPAVVSVAGPSSSLADGVYDVTLSYQDSSADPQASATSTGWTLDTTTLAPTLQVPTGGTDGSALEIALTLPEAPLSGSAALTFTGPTTVSLLLSAATAGSRSLTLDPSSLSPTAGVSQITPAGATLPDGTYTVSLRYQDALGNPSATTQQTGVVISSAPPASPPVTAPTPTQTPTPTPTPVATPAAPPSNAFTLLSARRHGARGAIALRLSLPDAGTVTVLGTCAPGPAGRHRTTCTRRGTAATTGARTLRLTVAATARGRRLLTRDRRSDRALRVRVTVTFTPAGGSPSLRTVTVTVLKHRRR
jgi:hypothetical protein